MSNPEVNGVDESSAASAASSASKVAAAVLTAVGGSHTTEARAEAAELTRTGRAPSVEKITPAVAAVLFTECNGMNRDFSESKAMQWRNDMANGEWKLNHQGIAFYKNGHIADGQHRLAAVALSGVTIETLVMRDFSEAALDTIDLGKGRSAGDALELRGVEDGKAKARIAKDVEEYLHQAEFGVRPHLSVAKIEKAVMDHNAELAHAIHVGVASVQNVTVPALTAYEAATVAYLLHRGGYLQPQIDGFMASLQQGIATYAQSPTVDLNGQFTRARLTVNKAHKLNKTAKLALVCKGIALWTEHKSVSKMKYSAKESLPMPNPPVAEANAA